MRIKTNLEENFMSTRTAIGVWLCVLAIALAESPASAATCSNASLKGVFGYSHGRPEGWCGGTIDRTEIPAS